MTQREVETTRVDIFIAGDIEQAKLVCREYCLEVGLCVTVEPVDYVYTGGEEAGTRIGLINYPRFPATPDEIKDKALRLADRLMHRLYQQSYSVVCPDVTIWRSRRPEDTPSPETNMVPDDRQSYPQGMTVNDLDAARKWLAKRWCVEHPNEGHVKQLAEYAASLRTTPSQTNTMEDIHREQLARPRFKPAVVKAVCQHCERVTIVPSATIEAAIEPPENHVLPPVVTGQMEIDPDVTAADMGVNAEPAPMETCDRCQGNGEIVTDWARYKHPHPGDVGDEAVAECPDCGGEGIIDVSPSPQTNLVGWEHISSAPRDGSEVLVWNGRRRHVAHFDKIEGEWVSSFKTTTKRLIIAPPPTHWSPLPAELTTTEGSAE